MAKFSRKEQILQSLATMLESAPGARITTASLAAQVGVSEAALYRHFPSKAKMFEGLIEFMEESLLPLINRINAEQPTAQAKCATIMRLLLMFAERNPGMARLWVGDALAGEPERLRARIRQLSDRIETELRNIFREWSLQQVPAPALGAAAMANLVLTLVEGRLHQFVRSEFTVPPTQHWEDQWVVIERALFNPTPRSAG